METEIKKIASIKPATTLKDQVSILKSRGLLIPDEDEAINVLECTNYYRLRGYYSHLQKKGSDDFKDGTTLYSILSLHDFDNELRVMLLGLLLDIEIVARARISYSIAHTWGPMGYRDQSNYAASDSKKYNELMLRIDEELGKSRERFIKTYNEKYAGQFPVWVAVEVMSYGEISKLYHLLPTNLKKVIANAYDNLDESMLTNWIYCCSILRNLCAHNSRLYARSIPMPISIEKDVKKKIDIMTNGKFAAKPQSLFSYLLAIRRLSRGKIWNSFLEDFKKVLGKYHNTVELIRLGIPDQWEQILSKK